jgi:hypothetical protein
MRFAFTYNRKNDKPKCLILGLFPKGIYVFHLSNTTTKSVEVGRQQLRSIYQGAHPRLTHDPFLNKESVAMG